MRFTIESLSQSTIQTKYGPKQKFRFVSNGQTVDAWAKKGYTDQFKVGYSFEAELAGKPFKGIDSVQWPRNDQGAYQPTAPQLNDAIKDTLSRIERKLDKLLEHGFVVKSKIAVDDAIKSMTQPEIPFAVDPHPTSEDEPVF